jgi:hypothetical protein
MECRPQDRRRAICRSDIVRRDHSGSATPLYPNAPVALIAPSITRKRRSPSWRPWIAVYPERDRNPASEVATKVQSGCADALR